MANDDAQYLANVGNTLREIHAGLADVSDDRAGAIARELQRALRYCPAPASNQGDDDNDDDDGAEDDDDNDGA